MANAPTSASAWRSAAREGELVELPSGNVARLRRTMNLATLLEKGRIPNPLSGLINDMIRSGKPQPDMKGADTEAIRQMLELVSSIMVKVFIEPRVEARPADADDDWEPSEGAISLDDIDLTDRMFIFAYAQGATLDLEQFRNASREALAGVPDVTALERGAVQPPGPDGPVPGVVSERGGVDVREPRRGKAGGGRKTTRQASGKGRGTTQRIETSAK